MRKTPLRKVSHKQELELRKRHALKLKLLQTGRKDADGYSVCWSCGQRPDEFGLQLSHTIPLARGGKTEELNLTLLCNTCHNREHGIKVV